jgi:hypothetical protein
MQIVVRGSALRREALLAEREFRDLCGCCSSCACWSSLCLSLWLIAKKALSSFTDVTNAM